MGYQLDDDFNCQKLSEPEDSVKSREGYVEWSVQEPQRIYSYRSASRKRSTLEDAAVEIMDTLHRYYTVYNRFVANPSNLHFKIQYTEPDSDLNETTQFTNTDSLTPENVKEYGCYAYLPGNSVFYDTNMKAIRSAAFPHWHPITRTPAATIICWSESIQIIQSLTFTHGRIPHTCTGSTCI